MNSVRIKENIIFDDPGALISILGAEDINIKITEDILNVVIYPKGNEIKIEGDRENVYSAISIINTLLNMYENSTTITKEKVINIAQNMLEKSGEKHKEYFKSIMNMKIKTQKHGKYIEMKTFSQGKYLEKMAKSDIVFSTGSAGTGKTFLAVAYGVSMIYEGKFEKIIITRPVVEAGESLGYLPGDFEEKISPYMRPVYDALHSLLNKETINRYMNENLIEVAPLAYMRGRTLSHSFIILDEAQNTTVSQMKMFLSRIGEKSKAIITGDTTQSDLPKGIVSGLSNAIKILKNIDSISFHEFKANDVVRHPIVAKILEAYEKVKT